ncbi:hypothetical protein LCGC14_0990550 [marine sediment metagenome]|uniref:Nucleotide-diphospho-sugar transferase domain-containing protein n=1 Tax=marine sediment metagenome TaxID=412755 RepID=A0A0F9QPC2_9ZZZZ
MNQKPRALIICVDFSDLLAITLPYNRHHFEEVLVVTTPADERSQDVARTWDADVYRTESFYDPGAIFNKWEPLEEGLDVMGREGWICLVDVDILWPKVLPTFDLKPNHLHGPRRRVMANAFATIPNDWSNFPLYLPNSRLIAGYSQIFHADDSHLTGLPWHETNWVHAAGADSYFQRQWPRSNRIRLPFDTLHLGKVGVNWCGRTSPYADGSFPKRAKQRMSKLLGMVKRIGYPRRGPHERYRQCQQH